MARCLIENSRPLILSSNDVRGTMTTVGARVELGTSRLSRAYGELDDLLLLQ